MSVINQVLKDLDERQPLAGEQDKYRIDAADDKHKTIDYMRIIVWVSAALLMFAAVAYYFWLESQVPDEQSFQPVSVSMTSVTSPVVVETTNDAKQTLPSQALQQQPVKPKNTSQVIAAPEAVKQEPAGQHEAKSYLPLKDDGKPLIVTAPVVSPRPDQKPKAEIVVVKTKKTGLELAREMLFNGRLTEAEKLLKDLIKEKPANLSARELLAGLLLRNNRMDEAAAEIATARKYYPRSDNLILLQAKMMLSRGEQQQVTQLLKQHVQSASPSEKSQALLASLYQQSGSYADAYALYNKLAKQRPASEEYWMGLAISLEGLQQPDKARHAYSRALQSTGLSPALRDYARKRMNSIDLQGNNNE